jgi:hypothetical protein
VFVLEACLHVFPTVTVEAVDNYIGSYLRHAPFKPGGSKYTVSNRNRRQVLGPEIGP